jgi:hypothetical protein
MRDGFVRVAVGTPAIRVGDTDGNAKAAVRLMHEAAESGAKLLTLPELCLTGYTAGVAVDGNNNVAVTGHFNGTVDFGGGGLTSTNFDIFVAKYNSAGTHLSSRRFGGAGDQLGARVAMARTGEVSVTGFFASTVDFGTGTLTSAGAYDAFLTSIGP